MRKQEAGDSEVDSSITQAEVTEVVRKLLGGKVPGVDEIRPEYLKSLDVVGLSWLTHLCRIAWRLGTVPLEWQTRGVPTTGESHFSASREGPLRQGTEEENSADSQPPQIQEEQGGFHPGCGTLDQLYTLHAVVLEGLWEFAQPVHMHFVDLEKAFDRVPRGILWGVLHASMGSGGLC
ncbi:hypothetical protein L3Q82_001313 [Scortum barcoo]|uniref:Uncharacterized protein n=1 Tax=Scortum barcoo TaxID=214431 RepID=A0ACB8W7I1_9TELE|nr:hypothetical protein L3Q82_001313 [Scortum barcoo]